MEEKQKVELTLPNPLNIAVQVPGLPGKDGKSAYEVAVDNGFTGTEKEWLESLKGKDGKDGVNSTSGTGEPVSMNFPTIKNMLDDRAILVDSDSLEDILRAIVKEIIPDGDYTNHVAPFALVNKKVEVGSTTVEVKGQPHFFIAEQDHRNLQQIPTNGTLTFTLSAPFDGEEKTLDILYPDVSKGVYNEITIPQNKAEQVI